MGFFQVEITKKIIVNLFAKDADEAHEYASSIAEFQGGWEEEGESQEAESLQEALELASMGELTLDDEGDKVAAGDVEQFVRDNWKEPTQ